MRSTFSRSIHVIGPFPEPGLDPDEHPARNMAQEFRLLSDLRRQQLQQLRPDPSGRGVIKAWARRAVRQVMKLDRLVAALNEVRHSRDMPRQIALARCAGCPDGDLGSAVIRHNRLMISFETTFTAKQLRCEAELARMRSQLTPRVLLNQARREWQLIRQDRSGLFQEPHGECIRHRKLHQLLELLMGLMNLLHADLQVPSVSRWLQERIEELRQHQRLQLLEIDQDENPA